MIDVQQLSKRVIRLDFENSRNFTIATSLVMGNSVFSTDTEINEKSCMKNKKFRSFFENEMDSQKKFFF